MKCISEQVKILLEFREVISKYKKRPKLEITQEGTLVLLTWDDSKDKYAAASVVESGILIVRYATYKSQIIPIVDQDCKQAIKDLYAWLSSESVL